MSDSTPFEISSEGCRSSERRRERARGRQIMANPHYDTQSPSLSSAPSGSKGKGSGKGTVDKKKEIKSDKMEMKKSTKSHGYSPVYYGKGKGGTGKKSSMPLCSDYCDMLNSYEFPTATYKINMTLSVLDTPQAAAAAVEELLQTEIAGSLAVCTSATRGRRRLDEAEGSMLAVDFSVAEETSTDCSGIPWDPSYEGVCATFVVTSTVTYDIGDPDQFVGDILDAITEECDTIAALEPVEEAFDPCTYLQIDYDGGIEDDGEEGDGSDPQAAEDEGYGQPDNTDDDGKGNGQESHSEGKGGTTKIDVDEDMDIVAPASTEEDPAKVYSPSSEDSNRKKKSGASVGALLAIGIVCFIAAFVVRQRRKRDFDGKTRDGLVIALEHDEKESKDPINVPDPDDTTVDSHSPGRSARDAALDEEAPIFGVGPISEDDMPISVKNPYPPALRFDMSSIVEADELEGENQESPIELPNAAPPAEIDTASDDLIVDTADLDEQEKESNSHEEGAKDSPTETDAQAEQDVHKCKSGTCQQCLRAAGKSVSFVAVDPQAQLEAN